MRKLLALFIIIALSSVILTLPVQSKESKYKYMFNLASDTKYYQYVDHKSTKQFDKVLLLRIVDKRPEEEKVFDKKTQFFGDDIWAESPVKMLSKIFLKEMRSSNIFKAVDVEGTTPSLILQIELLSLLGLYDENTRVARGVVKIRPILINATDNRIIMEKNNEDIKSNLVGRFSNAYRYMYRNIGMALNTVVKEMMGDLENALSKEFGK